MLRHPLSRTLSPVALLLAVLLPALILPTITLAAPDATMQQSLKKFFDNGVALRGATAELIRVESWPQTTGAVSWSLPNRLHGHPKRFSMIAQQGKKRWYVPVRVHWWTRAIVMKQPVPARSLLSRDMMIVKRTDIAGHSGHWWEEKSALEGMRLNRPLNKDAVVLSSYVNVQPMIKRGDIVQIILDLGHLHVRAEGKALRSGGKGDRLLVQNLRSKEVLQATIENRDTVRVRFNNGRQG
ncbi:flagella basal body P-ring formation protein FlgA [Mariprofundus micogutta]|uniref:Flagella basal body P-ring formation protein FlgA n=1 Tax=Mariprofundus micogutta TaxID=1921010 RepID=A0A1L8CKH6_9PROT|nr:flagellar basal body P-ring formation chaperone FlgA [Mariprofundus micogutta]GAV19428.1 flagella basal body P-ring formation protein FlgA [Mariprofundus micogutta]